MSRLKTKRASGVQHLYPGIYNECMFKPDTLFALTIAERIPDPTFSRHIRPKYKKIIETNK